MVGTCARCVWGAVNLRVPRYCGKNVIKVVDVMDILFDGEKRLLLVSVFGIIVLFYPMFLSLGIFFLIFIIATIVIICKPFTENSVDRFLRAIRKKFA